jgi:hypothetical protein
VVELTEKNTSKYEKTEKKNKTMAQRWIIKGVKGAIECSPERWIIMNACKFQMDQSARCRGGSTADKWWLKREIMGAQFEQLLCSSPIPVNQIKKRLRIAIANAGSTSLMYGSVSRDSVWESPVNTSLFSLRLHVGYCTLQGWRHCATTCSSQHIFHNCACQAFT